MFRLAFAVVFASLILLALASTANAKRAPICGKKPGDTLAQSSTWRVFSRASTKKLSDALDLYACKRLSHRALHIDRLPFTTEDTDIPRKVIVAGDFVAELGTWETGVADGTYVEGFDLNHRVRTMFGSPDTETYTDVQLSGTGALLVVVGVGGAQQRLDAYDAVGKRTLESEAFSDPAVGGNTAYWTNAATGAKSAAISGFASVNPRPFPKN